MKISRRVPRIKVLEKVIQKQILQYLTLKKVWAIRNNTGSFQIKRKDGSEGYAKTGERGLADIVAFTRNSVIWIECKPSTGGKQSDNQKEFQLKAEAHGHIYIVAKGIEDVQCLFGEVK